MPTLFVYIVASQFDAILCKANVYKVKKKYRQIAIQKHLVRAVFGEVLFDSLHRHFLGLILAQHHDQELHALIRIR